MTSGSNTSGKWLREELLKLDVTVNEEKTRVLDLASGEPFDFLGYTFRWIPNRRDPKKRMVLCRPQKNKRTGFLRELGRVMRRCLHVPVAKVVRDVINPRECGWVQYFR